MIQVTTALRCDRCRKWHISQLCYVAPILSRQVENIRGDAQKQGWARFRLKHTGPIMDVCPACVVAIQKEKEKAKR